MKLPHKYYGPKTFCNLLVPRGLRQATVAVELTGHKESDEKRILAATSEVFKIYKDKPAGKCSETGETLHYKCLVGYAHDGRSATITAALFCPKCGQNKAASKGQLKREEKTL